MQLIADQIRAYLDANPRAAETLDGIVHWWLLRQRFEDAWEQVESALEQLISEGLVSKGSGPTGETVYASAARRAESGRGDA